MTDKGSVGFSRRVLFVSIHPDDETLGCGGTILAQKVFSVIGVDLNQTKVDLINQGLPTIIEKDIDRIIKEQPEIDDYAIIGAECEVISTNAGSIRHV